MPSQRHAGSRLATERKREYRLAMTSVLPLFPLQVDPNMKSLQYEIEFVCLPYIEQHWTDSLGGCIAFQ